MNIKFLGHSCFLVENDGHSIIIDPFLTGNPNNAAKAEDIEVEAVLITHAHADHVGDAVAIAQKNDCQIITNYELAVHLSKKGAKIHPMHIGGSYSFDWGKVKFTPAQHGSGIDFEIDEDDFVYGGNPAGILLTMGGRTFYHAGDTGLFGDMKILGELHNINIAALPIGDNFTMGHEDALIAASWLNADIYIPMHYNTFTLIKSDPQIWVEKLKQNNLNGKVLEPGELVSL